MPGILISGENSFIGKSIQEYSSFKDIRTVSLRKVEPESVDFRGIDVIIHLAAIVHSSTKISLEDYLRINFELTSRFASCAKRAGVKHFIFMSTSKVYGSSLDRKVCNENSECNPEDDYGRSKYQAELALNNLATANFFVSIIRTPLVFGKGNKANILRLSKLIRMFPLLPLGKSGNRRNFTYIENLVSYIDRIIETRLPGVFIAIDKDPVSTSDLIHFMSESMGINVKLFSLPRFLRLLLRKLDPLDYERLFGSAELDNSITLERLAFTPAYSTRDGIYKTFKVL